VKVDKEWHFSLLFFLNKRRRINAAYVPPSCRLTGREIFTQFGKKFALLEAT
jgi:hypothetical protein